MSSRSAVALIGALAALALAPWPSQAVVSLPRPWPVCVPRSQPIRLGAHEVVSSPVDARISDVTLHSDAMQRDEHVDVMLPEGYGHSGSKRYAVLYLLHGAIDDYRSYVRHSVEQIVGGRPLIVVMPNDGLDGSYSDWYGNELGFPGPTPAWESFHVRELIPWIDAHYRTIAAARGRAVAGLSSGGGGTMKYAVANPGLFAAAGEFSGAVDTDLAGYYALSEILWGITYGPGAGPPGHCTWGDPSKQQVIWEDEDPTYEASNLHGTRLFLASGNGQPGPYDSPTSGLNATEEEVWNMNQAFEAALGAARIPHTVRFYGNGTHTWPYWQRDLSWFLEWLAPTLGRPLSAPRSFDMRSARAAFAAWGWSFVPRRAVREFDYVTRVGRSGLDVTGSGSLDVVTAPLYKPGAQYAIAISARTTNLRAGRDGRLRFSIALGPSHTTQQSEFGPRATAGWRTARVRIAPTKDRKAHR